VAKKSSKGRAKRVGSFMDVVVIRLVISYTGISLPRRIAPNVGPVWSKKRPSKASTPVQTASATTKNKSKARLDYIK
jgi:hypothetical protein